MAADLLRLLRAVERTLQLSTELQGVTLKVNEPENLDPQKCPWIGLYDAEFEEIPRTLSNAAGTWQTTAQVSMLLQQVSRKDGRQAWERLHTLRAAVENALRGNIQLADADGNAAQHLARITGSPGPRSGTTEGGYFYSSVVLTAEYMLKA